MTNALEKCHKEYSLPIIPLSDEALKLDLEELK
jgi:hypothetical protein